VSAWWALFLVVATDISKASMVLFLITSFRLGWYLLLERPLLFLLNRIQVGLKSRYRERGLTCRDTLLSSSRFADFTTQISSGLSKEQVTILVLSLRLQVVYTTCRRPIGHMQHLCSRMTRSRLSSLRSIPGQLMERKKCLWSSSTKTCSRVFHLSTPIT
jgi:hypothetical protein